MTGTDLLDYLGLALDMAVLNIFLLQDKLLALHSRPWVVQMWLSICACIRVLGLAPIFNPECATQQSVWDKQTWSLDRSMLLTYKTVLSLMSSTEVREIIFFLKTWKVQMINGSLFCWGGWMPFRCRELDYHRKLIKILKLMACLLSLQRWTSQLQS